MKKAATIALTSFLLTLMPAGVPPASAGIPLRTNSCDPAHADILRLYQAFFGRAPDAGGAAYWFEIFDSGTSVDEIAEWFAQSEEASITFEGLSVAQFVEQVYRNMFGRAPDPDGRRYWGDLLVSGDLTPAQVVRWMSVGDEFANRYPVETPSICRAMSDARPVAPGIVVAERSGYRVAMIDLDLADVSVSDNQRARVGELGGDLAVNGNWFLSSGVQGPAMTHGRMYGTDARWNEYTLYIGPEFGHAEIRTAGGRTPFWAEHAVSGHPRLLLNEEITSDDLLFSDAAMAPNRPRTAAGKDSAGRLILVQADSENARSMAELMLVVGAVDAVMLDGGGSSGMVYEGSKPAPRRNVMNQIIVTGGPAL